ncbi:MAG: hypothetical protein J6T64_06260, partial [Bacteroidaceae bacterium]|nr:hypothetical protein [Bacteroidaceae bacterium]
VRFIQGATQFIEAEKRCFCKVDFAKYGSSGARKGAFRTSIRLKNGVVPCKKNGEKRQKNAVTLSISAEKSPSSPPEKPTTLHEIRSRQTQRNEKQANAASFSVVC